MSTEECCKFLEAVAEAVPTDADEDAIRALTKRTLDATKEHFAKRQRVTADGNQDIAEAGREAADLAGQVLGGQPDAPPPDAPMGAAPSRP